MIVSCAFYQAICYLQLLFPKPFLEHQCGKQAWWRSTSGPLIGTPWGYKCPSLQNQGGVVLWCGKQKNKITQQGCRCVKLSVKTTGLFIVCNFLFASPGCLQIVMNWWVSADLVVWISDVVKRLWITAGRRADVDNLFFFSSSDHPVDFKKNGSSGVEDWW